MMISEAEWGATSFTASAGSVCDKHCRRCQAKWEKKKFASLSITKPAFVDLPLVPPEQSGEALPLWRATLQWHHLQEGGRTKQVGPEIPCWGSVKVLSGPGHSKSKGSSV